MYEKEEESESDIMGREIWNLLRPRFVIVFLIGSVLVFLAFSSFFQQEEETMQEVHEITHRVFLEVDIDKQRLGRIVIGLYGEVVPKTKISVLYVQGNWERVLVGNESIYGGTFRDENFKIKHSHAGMVAMVNSGPDSNGSQFFITTVKAYWLDGEHVVFGKVIEGMDNVYAIEGGAGTYSGKPRKKVVISDSGEIPKSEWNGETRSTATES
ncbi:hypothetical protein OSB04_014274 [Centaurea solstitialis]|uniref:PPIase cyclophilin-type domain-containing protein n=1 Tax=Centaurea solstitialis TaxID=347529 RepID=A0AA38SWS7_9ASTR|nr:hypothetical protein OSB04_014274 [Centaurea solstitialis]